MNYLHRSARGGAGLVIVIALVVIVVLLFFVSTRQSPQTNAEPTPDPGVMAEKALRAYIQAATELMNGQAHPAMENLQALVLPEDWAWYELNVDAMLKRQVQTLASVQPPANDEEKKVFVLRHLVRLGANRSDCVILSRSVTENQVNFRIKQRVERYGSSGYDEEVVARVVKLDNGEWRILGFGGGRELMENM